MEKFRMTLQLVIRSASVWKARIRTQQISLADNQLYWILANLEQLLDYELTRELSENLMADFAQFMDAYQNQDYELASDYMDMGIIAPLKQLAGACAEQFEPLPMDESYHVEYSASGMTTISKCVKNRWLYLHTNDCPLEEAAQLTERWREKGICHYVIAGLGFGYHVFMLSQNPLLEIDIYEEDEEMIQLAKRFSDVKELLNSDSRIRLHSDPGYQEFRKAAMTAEPDETSKVCVYHPSIQTIGEDGLRDKMEQLFMQLDNAERWADHMWINFNRNRMQIQHEVGELRSVFQDKTVYLAAGGPSLEQNLSQLVHRSADELLLTVGTSFRRCLSEHTSPDYVIITDPKEHVYCQIEGLQDGRVPMILLSTAFAWLGRDYQGEKYLVFQKGYKKAEEIAEKNNWKLYEGGSSVVTTALDLCIGLGCKKVVFLGLDLAFTGGKSHAGQDAAMTDLGLSIEDIHGNRIPTSKNLNLYREWIERRIEREQQSGSPIRFIDASEGGAKIQGTEIMTLQEAMKE